MRRLQPKAYLIGETRLDAGNLYAYLRNEVGTKWWPSSEHQSDSEKIIETMGRLCYRSFEAGLNPNVTKVRESSKEYINNLLKSEHGSVLEHAQSNWIFANVSRVFTHELVRHRAGCAYSQESLRYVRLTDLGLWLPPQIEEDKVLKELFELTFENLEELQKKVSDYLQLDSEKDFTRKKIMTSAMRRIAPEGLSTSIGASFNFRALRHIIEMRTSEHAEAEIREVFSQVATTSVNQWPLVFQDFRQNEKGEWKPNYHKI